MHLTNSDSVWFKIFVVTLCLLLLVAGATLLLLAYTAFDLRSHVPNLLALLICLAFPTVILLALFNCSSTRLTRLISGLLVLAFSALTFLALSFSTDPTALSVSSNALVADLPKYLDALRYALAISFAAIGGNIAAGAIVESPSRCSCSAHAQSCTGGR